MTERGDEIEIEVIRRRLAGLEVERLRLEERLRRLQQSHDTASKVPAPINSGASISNSSLATDKIAFFRRLFGGRTDVFPARWDNPKTGRSGCARAPIVTHLRAA